MALSGALQPHAHAQTQPERRAAESVSSRDVFEIAVQAGMADPDTIRRGSVILVFATGGRTLAESMAATISPLPAMPVDILQGDPPVTVFLARDEAGFAALTGGRAPEWGAGVAFPTESRIVLPAYESRRGSVHELGRVLRHELAHVGLQRFVGDLQVPRWFTEGYSTWTAGQLDTNAGWLLRLAFLTGRAPALDSLTLDWPSRVTDARIAYLLSASVIGYLYENGGDRVLRVFLERWREVGGFEQALFDTYGLGLVQLERYWGEYVRRRYGWLTFAAQSVVIWAFGAVLVIVLFALRRRHNRERLARLRDMELPDDPEYWVRTRGAWPDDANTTDQEPPEGGGAGPRSR